MRRIALVLLLLASPALAQQPSPTPVLDEAALARIAETKKRLEQTRQKIALAEEKEEALLAAINAEDEKIFELAEDVAKITEQVDAAKKKIAEDKAAIEAYEAKIARRKRWLAGRLRSLYVHGRPGYLKILFASESYADLLRRSKYQSIVSRHDAEMVGALKADVLTASTRQQNYTLDLADLEKMQQEESGKVESLELQRDFRRTLLAEVQSERADLAKLARALEAASHRLTETVGNLGSSEPIAVRPFTGAKGKILTPVTNAPIARGFGPYKHPKLGVELVHQGIKYATAMNTPVHVVWDGKIEAAKWIQGYGEVVIVDHGGGWRSLYAHVGRVLEEKDTFVKEGQVIALSGETGSVEGPELFFAIYFEGKPVDPADWLLLGGR